jgi:hypothetical protein
MRRIIKGSQDDGAAMRKWAQEVFKELDRYPEGGPLVRNLLIEERIGLIEGRIDSYES